MDWFRFHNEAVDDPKVQRLPAELFKTWVNLLCIASRNDGIIPPDRDDLSFSLRIPRTKLESQIKALIKAELLDEDETLRPHNWNGRQYKSDSSGERVKRYRERQRNVTPTVTETPPETETETETEQKKKEDARETALPLPDPPDHDEAIRLWNEMASECSLPRCDVLNATRKRNLAKRLAECAGLEGWRYALGKIRGSPFLRGENERGWRADIDFVLTQSKFTKIMEGGYDRSGGVQGANLGELTGFAAVAAELAAGSGDGWVE